MENNRNPLDGVIDILKKNADLIKGSVALLLGFYFISIKYYVVVDFLIFAIGAILVFYGLTALRIANLQAFLYKTWYSMHSESKDDNKNK